MSSLFPEPTEPRAVSARSSHKAWINAHCDGGARGNPGPAGYGAVVQDDSGNVLAELSEFLGHRTNNFAEYSGLLGCLQWALDNGYKHLRVVSDSELMVKQIQGKYKVNSPDLKPLWEEAKWRISKLESFQITHALRHKNKAADKLANDAMDRGAKQIASEVVVPATLPVNPPKVKRQTPDPAIVRVKPQMAATPSGPEPEAPEPVKAEVKPQPVHRAPAPPILEPVVPESEKLEPAPPEPAPGPAKSGPRMLRGFTRDGIIHLLGGERLSDGVFVKIIVE